MSGIKGQNTQSIQKKSWDKGRYPVVGTKNLKFHHKASVGESVIDLTSLVTTGTGLTNPSPTDLTKIRLKDFVENLVLFVSSAKGTLMEGNGSSLGYSITDNQTISLNFEAEEGEIFTGIYSNATINGTVIADVRTPGASGSLLEDARDFNLGEAVPIDDLTNQFPIQVYRGTDAKLMKRNTGNAAFVADHSIGNYEMLDRGDGWCQVIRFNLAGDVGDEDVCWSARGALGERPNLSVLQQVDSINGIVDLMKDDLLETTGFDVTDPTRYDGVATNSDLKAFGDRVLTLEKLLTAQVLKTFYAEIDGSTIGAPFTGGTVYVYRIGRKVTVQFSDVTHSSSGSPSTDSSWLPSWAYSVDSVNDMTLMDSNHLEDYSFGFNGAGQFEYRTFAGASFNKTAAGNFTLNYVSVDTDETQTLAHQLGL